MVSSKDHKRAFDGDMGPNTGGMGTISPNPFYTEEQADWCMEHIFKPTIAAMNAEGRPFKGCLYFGLMLTPDGPKVIEYNCRFGDPETQVVLPRLKTDFIDILEAVIEERLAELPIEWSEDACACVVMASGGYPAAYKKGLVIQGLDEHGRSPGLSFIMPEPRSRTAASKQTAAGCWGSRPRRRPLEEALDKAYDAVARIDFDGAHYRRDIGKTE